MIASQFKKTTQIFSLERMAVQKSTGLSFLIQRIWLTIKYTQVSESNFTDNIILCAPMKIRWKKPAETFKFSRSFKLQPDSILSKISCYDSFNQGLPPKFKINTMKEWFIKTLYFVLYMGASGLPKIMK